MTGRPFRENVVVDGTGGEETVVVTLAYERQGTGAPLVLLHGLGHRRQGWRPVIDLLAREFDVIAVDLPGFGESSPVGPRWREDLTPAISAFCDDLGLKRPHVAGNSLGGALALELAISGRVASATALAPAGFWTTSERRRALATLHTLRATTFLPVAVQRSLLASRQMRRWTYGVFVGEPDRLPPAAILDDSLAMRAGKSFRPVARHGRGYAVTGTLQCPVTVAWGTRDRILPYVQADRARQRFPEARHVDLPGCGHVPMSDDPVLVATTIGHTVKGRRP
ncbi:alpha/beta fold hydrolase [Actinopolymorpha sp. B17G11]|uniref:alpha/beta fold hydrolase n=1 Tax=unclassified Actinopolymorpha TaxID=2627063 RepID=UPI0032D927CD